MSNRLSVKDLATIGIFSAIMIVVFIAFSMITGASLFFNMVLNAVFAAFILAPFFVYMAMKVNKPGVVLIYNTLHGFLSAELSANFPCGVKTATGTASELP